ncbi:MAG TPA: phosphatase PAP2 family protein [Vicinamibacterales bacterium]|nr:phosphatase PAP2 family protein [Vicinamibacterales bacterium]
MRTSEALAFSYFAACCLVPWLRPLPRDRRLRIAGAGALMCLALVAVARLAPPVVRDWAPGLSILVGYYVTGWFFVRPSLPLEQWLMSWDRRVFGDPTTRFARWPRPLMAYLEIVYIGCFLVLPAGFAILAANGHAALADRYWTIVEAAEFGAFAPLVVIQTRPPWAIERKPVLADRAVHRLASLMTENLTIRVNTFPSGHVAGSLAVALALLDASPGVGVAALLLAFSISVAAVVGRYHYFVDGIAGAALALAVWMVAHFAGL